MRITFAYGRGMASKRVLTAVVVSGLLAAVSIPTAAVAAVPVPDAQSAVVTVRTGGDRVSDDVVGSLAGVQLGLFATETATTPEAVCTSDADGDCSFVLDGALLGSSFWVGSVAVPAGWYDNPVLRTGPASGSSSTASAYRFPTPAVQAGQTYRSTREFMYSSSNSLPTRSNGVWQQSRVNPTLDAQCGSDVAIVMDLSASVGSSLPQLKQAADAFANALVGTPSRAAVFSFSRQSPSVETATGQPSENRPELVSLSTQAGADAFTAQYAGWSLGSGTNWDRALQEVAAAAPSYDVVIVLTDGNPDRWGATHGDGSNTHFTDVEAAVFSANTLKAEGSRIISFGVGSGVEGISALNLAAISGPVAFDGTNLADADYFQTADYAAAADQLGQLALAGCAGSLSVVKQLVPGDTTGEDVTGAVPAGEGWTFDAQPATPGTVIAPATAATVADGTGTVSFELTPPAGSSTSGVTVAERQQDGYTLVTQGGENATCTDLTTGTAVPVTSVGATGFTVDVAAAAAVSCTVYNRAPAPAAIVVNKLWVVDGEDYADGAQPAGLTAALALTGPGTAGATPQPFGVSRGGYVEDDAVTISETTTIEREGCTLNSSSVEAAGGATVSAKVPATVTLAPGDNAYLIRNVVTCAVTPSPEPTDPGTGTEPPTGSGSLPATGLDQAALSPLIAGAVAAVLAGLLLQLARRRRS